MSSFVVPEVFSRDTQEDLSNYIPLHDLWTIHILSRLLAGFLGVKRIQKAQIFKRHDVMIGTQKTIYASRDPR